MRPIRQITVLLVTAIAVCACDPKPPEYGVLVFSVDTVQATFTASLEGSLALSLRSEGVSMRQDKSLSLTTPASMMWARGDGNARIEVIKGNGIVLQPAGFPADSADTTSVEGRVINMTRPPGHRYFTFKVLEAKKTAPESAPSKSNKK